MNTPSPTTKSLVQFLSNKSKNDSFIQRLKIAYRPLICPFVELIEHAQSAKSVFDIGCGAGQFCLLIAEFTPVTKISGIEIKEELIKEASILLKPYEDKKEISFHTFDGKSLPNEISQYDLLFMIDVFHHIPITSQKSFLKAVYDKMKPGATFILKDIDAASPLVFMNKLHDLLFAGEIGKEYSNEKMGKLVQDIGFTVIANSKKRMWWYPHFTYVLRK